LRGAGPAAEQVAAVGRPRHRIGTSALAGTDSTELTA
jgi:hypothetical protein